MGQPQGAGESGPVPEGPEGGCCQPHPGPGSRVSEPPASVARSRQRSDAQAGHQRVEKQPAGFQRPVSELSPSSELLLAPPAFLIPTHCPAHCRHSCGAAARSGRQSRTSHFDSWPGKYFGVEQRARTANSVSSEQPLYALLLGACFTGCEGAGFGRSTAVTFRRALHVGVMFALQPGG